MDVGLCQPSNTILLVATAGVIYHLLAGDTAAMLWWIVVGVAGTGVFQGLCYGGLEPVAWVLMAIPVLVVCFFLAVALFASRMRIENIVEVPCGRCGHRHPAHDPCRPRCPACGGNGCSQCQEAFENQAAVTMTGCPLLGTSGQSGRLCSDRGCPYCAYKSAEAADALKIPAADLQKPIEKFHGDGRCQSGEQACASCGGSGCPYCAYEASLCRDCQGRGCASCNRDMALSTY